MPLRFTMEIVLEDGATNADLRAAIDNLCRIDGMDDDAPTVQHNDARESIDGIEAAWSDVTRSPRTEDT